MKCYEQSQETDMCIQSGDSTEQCVQCREKISEIEVGDVIGKIKNMM